MTQEDILEALKAVKYPGFSRDIVSFGLVKNLHIEGGNVEIALQITTSDRQVVETIEKGVVEAAQHVEGVKKALVRSEVKAPVGAAMQAGGGRQGIPGVKHIVAIASGKGGVGKSMVSTNLACALLAEGLTTGLCDCDMYGPSIGLMFGATARPTVADEEKINPIEQHGLKLMSMSFLVNDDAPVILRGPMVTRYTQQFLHSVAWGNLDVLLLDLPPGTGDIQLTIVQTVALTGAVVVTTPQEVALIDARKASGMFEKVNVKVLGIVENMSYFLCPNDGNKYHIFGSGGGTKEAARLDVPFLGEIPLDIAAREAGDQGFPITLKDPEHPVSQAFKGIAQKIKEILGQI